MEFGLTIGPGLSLCIFFLYAVTWSQNAVCRESFLTSNQKEMQGMILDWNVQGQLWMAVIAILLMGVIRSVLALFSL